MNLETLNNSEPEKHEQSVHDGDDTSGLDVLDNQETEFVATTEKKPINQTAMMLFAILTIGMGGIWAMNHRSGAPAAHAADAGSVAAQSTIGDFMQRGGSSNISLLRALLEGTAKIVEQFKIPNIVQIPLSALKSNPFHFATAKVATIDDGSEAARKRKEEEKTAIQAAVRSLQLQSLVIRANRKACMINNVLYQEGELIDGFTIQTISNEGVIVKQAGYRFRLQMAK